MDSERYAELSDRVECRARHYIQVARTLADEGYGPETARDIPLISVQLAAAMMNMEAAEIMSDCKERIAQAVEKT